MTDEINAWRTQSMYTYAEAAHLAHVSSSTVRNWLVGYEGKNRKIRPLFSPNKDQGPMVSFLQLIEIVLAAQFRKTEHVKFETVHSAYIGAKKQLGLEYPFAGRSDCQPR